MNWQEWNSWANPLWSWLTAILLMVVSAYVMFIVCSWTIPHGWVGAAICGIIYSLLMAWGACMFAFKAAELSRKKR